MELGFGDRSEMDQMWMQTTLCRKEGEVTLRWRGRIKDSGRQSGMTEIVLGIR